MALDFLHRWTSNRAHNESVAAPNTGPGESCPTPGARRIVVITGAGMSADAGLPTYRGPGGRYENGDQPPVHAQDLVERPGDVFAYVRDLREQSDIAKPHRGHEALTACQRQLNAAGGDVTLVTMNIDDLHERADSPVVHLHGRAWQECCTVCDYRAEAKHAPSPCPLCGAALRPDVVLFGERTDPEATYTGKRALRNADAVYVVGSSGIAASIDRWLLAARRDFGIPTVLITKAPAPPFIELFDVVIDDRGERLGCYLPDPT